MSWRLQCSVCSESFPLTKVYRESIGVEGHFCSKECWDKCVEVTA